MQNLYSWLNLISIWWFNSQINSFVESNFLFMNSFEEGDRKLMILWWLVKMSATSSYYEKHSISYWSKNLLSKSELGCRFLPFLYYYDRMQKNVIIASYKNQLLVVVRRNAYWLQLEQAMKCIAMVLVTYRYIQKAHKVFLAILAI